MAGGLTGVRVAVASLTELGLGVVLAGGDHRSGNRDGGRNGDGGSHGHGDGDGSSHGDSVVGQRSTVDEAEVVDAYSADTQSVDAKTKSVNA